MANAKQWRLWFLAAAAIWVIPGCMLGIWGSCYTEVFGEPPCGPWAGYLLDALFVGSFLPIVWLLYCSRHHPVMFALTYVLAVAEIGVAGFIWYLGGLSVSGFYF